MCLLYCHVASPLVAFQQQGRWKSPNASYDPAKDMAMSMSMSGLVRALEFLPVFAYPLSVMRQDPASG
jgi:hypothetical protein